MRFQMVTLLVPPLSLPCWMHLAGGGVRRLLAVLFLQDCAADTAEVGFE
ncbi:hypothetical protein [Streptomyces sp. NPDC001893]